MADVFHHLKIIWIIKTIFDDTHYLLLKTNYFGKWSNYSKAAAIVSIMWAFSF